MAKISLEVELKYPYVAQDLDGRWHNYVVETKRYLGPEYTNKDCKYGDKDHYCSWAISNKDKVAYAFQHIAGQFASKDCPKTCKFFEKREG